MKNRNVLTDITPERPKELEEAGAVITRLPDPQAAGYLPH